MDRTNHDPIPGTISRRHLLRGFAAAGLAMPCLLPTGVGAAPGPGDWRLRVHGLVQRPVDLSLADLQRHGGETVAPVLECAAYGRATRAEWTGMPLREVLDLVGAREDAVAVVAWDNDGRQRAIPLRDVPAAGPLLASWRDGEPLDEDSGPVRLIVPGWVAETSVRRLAAIELADRVPAAPAPADPADRRLRPLREMPPRAVITAPAEGACLRDGRQAIRGYAWSGYAPIEKVAVTADGGATWNEAEIVERIGRRGWVAFAVEWDARPGPAMLAARATDAFGLTQPLDVPDRARGFVHNAVSPISVFIAG
jgi:DMSO/TMAO reductase YedYZ molybdopterin-dependent catalytic subunit